MVHAWCVQVLVSAAKASLPVRATRKPRPDAFTSAALPTVLSGEAPSMVSMKAPPVIVLVSCGNCGTLAPPDGLVELPPQPGSRMPSAASDAAWHACWQNARRDVEISEVTSRVVTGSPLRGRQAPWLKQ